MARMTHFDQARHRVVRGATMAPTHLRRPLYRLTFEPKHRANLLGKLIDRFKAWIS